MQKKDKVGNVLTLSEVERGCDGNNNNKKTTNYKQIQHRLMKLHESDLKASHLFLFPATPLQQL